MTLSDFFRRFARAVSGTATQLEAAVEEMHAAIYADDPAAVAAVLAQNPKPEAWSLDYPEFTTPLPLALAHNKLKAAGAMLDAKPEWLETRDSKGLTPLQWAALNRSDAATFDFLASRGADMEAKAGNGDNVTMMAIRHSALEAATLLICKGGHIDLSDPVIETQLRVATYEMNRPFLMLVDHLQQQGTESCKQAQANAARARNEAAAGQMHDGIAQDIRVRTLKLRRGAQACP